jgi:hypothetical protein
MGRRLVRAAAVPGRAVVGPQGEGHESIIEALHDGKRLLFEIAQMRPALGTPTEADHEITERLVKHKDAWVKEFHEAGKVLVRITDMSSFLLCDAATKVLEECDKECQRILMERDAGRLTHDEFIDSAVVLFEQCLSEIKEIGKRDLGVK